MCEKEEKEICEIFSRNLNRYLQEYNISQTELSKRLGASKSQVSFWCNGKNVPRTNYLAKLTKLFGCELSDLLLDKKRTPPKYGEAPIGYDKLSAEKRTVVDALIIQLAGEQSKDQ